MKLWHKITEKVLGACSTPTYSILHREKPGRMCFVAPNTPHADKGLWPRCAQRFTRSETTLCGCKVFPFNGCSLGKLPDDSPETPYSSRLGSSFLVARGEAHLERSLLPGINSIHVTVLPITPYKKDCQISGWRNFTKMTVKFQAGETSQKVHSLTSH